MLVASTDPLIVYYHDGFLRISMLKYNKDSSEVYLLIERNIYIFC